MEEENYRKKEYDPESRFRFIRPLPLLFNFYDVSPYFYYASCFMIEYVMEDIEFRDIPFSVYATTNRTKIYVGIIFYNNALNVSIWISYTQAPLFLL